jgi:hypothetical protein
MDQTVALGVPDPLLDVRPLPLPELLCNRRAQSVRDAASNVSLLAAQLLGWAEILIRRRTQSRIPLIGMSSAPLMEAVAGGNGRASVVRRKSGSGGD